MLTARYCCHWKVASISTARKFDGIGGLEFGDEFLEHFGGNGFALPGEDDGAGGEGVQDAVAGGGGLAFGGDGAFGFGSVGAGGFAPGAAGACFGDIGY